MPTVRRQTSWLFTKRNRGFELGDYRETNPASDRVEALKPGSPDYNTSALNHSATLPPFIARFSVDLGFFLETSRYQCFYYLYYRYQNCSQSDCSQQRLFR